MKIIELTGTTDALGDLTMTAGSSEVGYVEKVVMDYDDGDTGADIVVTNEDGTTATAILTATNIGTADATWMPRVGHKVADGTAFTDSGDKVFVTGKMKIVVAQGGNAKNFRFLVTLTDEA